MATSKRTRLLIAQSSGQTNPVAAEQALAEGTQLYQQGTEESLLHAIEKFQAALKLSQEMGDKGGEAEALNDIATVYEDLGEKEQALDYYNQVLPLLSADSDRANKAVTLNNIGYVYSDLGDNQKALEYYNQALPLSHAVGDRLQEATTLNNIGTIYSDSDNQKALEYYNQALSLLQAVGDRKGEANTLSNIGQYPTAASLGWEHYVDSDRSLFRHSIFSGGQAWQAWKVGNFNLFSMLKNCPGKAQQQR